jgi:hypothetical protein
MTACAFALALCAGHGALAAEKARTLSGAQQAAVEKVVAQYAPLKVDIFTFGDMAELTGFGGKLSTTLQAAGWKPKIFPIDNGVAYGVVGVAVFSRQASGDRAEAAAAALVDALRAQKIVAGKFEAFKTDEPPADRFAASWDPANVGDVRVFIGLAPP